MEIWKDIEGYEGLYQVSNLGRVKSLSRHCPSKGGSIRRVQERQLRFKTDRYGYLCLGLNNAGKTHFTVHRLVAAAFIPNPDLKPCVNHIDGVKTNNHIDNLEWCTVRENSIHAVRTGLSKAPEGEKCGASKLKATQVLIIIDMIKKGQSYKEISEMFGISRASITLIKQNKNWKIIPR